MSDPMVPAIGTESQPPRRVTKRLRYEIFRRDNHACRYCGQMAPAGTLTIDHVIPVALGGDNSPANLVTACTDCNSGKSSSSPDAPLVEDVEMDALRWRQAMQRAAYIAEAQREKRDEIRDAVWNTWHGWTYIGWDRVAQQNVKRHIPIDSGWKVTVDNLHAAGLTAADLTDAVDTAMSMKKVQNDDKWRYFCGVAWTMVRNRQEVARALIARDDA